MEIINKLHMVFDQLKLLIDSDSASHNPGPLIFSPSDDPVAV